MGDYAKGGPRAREAKSRSVYASLTQRRQLEASRSGETDTDPSTVQAALLRWNSRRGLFAFGPLLARPTPATTFDAVNVTPSAAARVRTSQDFGLQSCL